MRMLVVAFAIVAIVSTFANAQDKRTVTVEGKAETKATPDLATLKFGIVVKSRELIGAKDEVDATIVRVAKAITECGIHQTEIHRSKINITTEFEEQDKNETNPMYFVERDLEAVCSVKLVDTVLRTATKAGANRIYDILYSVTDESEISQKTLLGAIKNAKDHAAFLASNFDAKLGKALKIEGDRDSIAANLSLVVRADQNSVDDSTYVPDSITISRTVKVVFELVD